MNTEEIARIVGDQRAYFKTHATFDVDARRRALVSLRDAVRAHEADIAHALKTDLGKSHDEAYMCEIGTSLSEIRHQIAHVARWSRPRLRPCDLANAVSVCKTQAVPYGVTLIMAPWNYPFLLTLEPLAGALAAGNTVVIKPSAYAPASSAVLKQICEEAFDPRLVTVVEGGRAENEALLDECWDKIFFTGSVPVGKLVMERASKNLTPVTLELGGKSPCIVDATANLKVAARRIAFGKWLNVGQTCVAPDYLLVDARVLKQVAQNAHAVAGGLGVRQHQGHHVLLAQTAGLRRHIAVLALVAPGGHVVHERIGAADALVGGKRLGCGHANIELVETGLGPDTVARDNIGDARIAHGVIGQLNGQVAQDARVDTRLLVGMHYAHALGLEYPIGRVLIAGNKRRPVVARVLTNQNRCARHAHPP